MLLWPLVKKQLHQTKVMRQVQPEIKKIKARAKGDKMLESQLTMELYKEKGVKPFSSILVLLVQLPIFIAVFTVIRNYNGFLESFVYPFLQDFGNIPNMVASPMSPHFFGIDLAGDVLTDVAANWPILIMAILAAGLQFFQSRQTMPQSENKKKLREYFKDAAAGKEVDQAEMSSNMTRNMMYLFPIMTFVIAISLPGAVVLYFMTQSAIAVAQQQFILKRDVKELEEIADERTPIKKQTTNVQEAVIVKRPSKSIKENKPKSGGSGKTIVRRIRK
jgi:YidC/Oxa1 family membrane protein insertase